MLRMSGTEVASSRSVGEDAGRYEMAVRKSNVRSNDVSMTKDRLRALNSSQ
jgi:hypothetical protein